jgi:hypothetical protein
MDVDGFSKSFSLDQGDVLGNDQVFQALYSTSINDPKREGICTGLSMIWLARLLMWHQENAQERKKVLFTGAAFRWGGKTQDIHLAAGTGGADLESSFKGMYGAALKAYALSIVNGSCGFFNANNIDSTSKQFAKTLTTKGDYRLWNLGLRTSTGNAGHMVASYASSGKLGLNRHLYFFDPNMGEYKISVGDSAKFVKGFLEAYAASFVGINYISSFAVRRG